MPLTFPSWEGLGVGSSYLLPTPDSRLPIPYSLFPIPYSLSYQKNAIRRLF
ncbi:MAG: hypothetical protein F6J94_11250 [Moorea sp. SIO1F2]|nr:hypothetical protein [Moorena sp. SIO1F2]